MTRSAAFGLALVAAAASASADPGDPGAGLDDLVDGDASITAEPAEDTLPRAWRGIAAIEVGITLSIATVRYQFDGERKENWDFPSLKQRFTLEAWRYDNNPFGINYFAHAFEGTIFHLIGRTNNMGLGESAALGFLSSFAWEFLFEFREKVSINDVLFTPASGIVIGEFFYWLGRYVDSAPEDASFGQTAARYTFGLPHAVHRHIAGASPVDFERRDRFGLRADIWHRFDLAASVGGLAGRGASTPDELPDQLAAARAAGRLVAIDGYRRPGRFARWFAAGNVSEAALEHTRGDGADGTRFWAETVMLGLYRQAIDGSDHSGLRRGWGWMLGAAMSYDYRREQLGAWRERLALMHLPGIAADGELHVGDITARLGARLHADFASLEAIAHRQWKDANPDEINKTILRKQGYYFGWGGSLRLLAELELDGAVGASVGGSLLAGAYDSDEGLDRSQEGLTADVDIDDRAMELESWFRLRPIAGGPHLELRLLHQRHRTDHDGIEASQTLTRFSAGLGVSF